jgi:prepilin-type N-terminal cleavage/methylation domain-containing protein/prepilin-type processing-associated H-X9-DG protein
MKSENTNFACLAIRNRQSPIGNRFTLVELLVVIAIIAILASLLLPGLKAASEAGKKSVCGGYVRQINLGMLEYTYDNNDWIPSLWCWWRDEVPSAWSGQPLFQSYGLGAYVSTNIFSACPVSNGKKYGLNECLGSVGFGGDVWPPKAPKIRLSKVRKPEKTLSFIDGTREFGDDWCARPRDYTQSGMWLVQRRYGWERHNFRPNFVCVDGHVETEYYDKIDYRTSANNYWKP